MPAVFAPDGHVQPGAKYTLHESHIQSASLVPSAVLSIFWSPHAMMRPDAKVEKVYLYPKQVDFRKSIDGLLLARLVDAGVANAAIQDFDGHVVSS